MSCQQASRLITATATTTTPTTGATIVRNTATTTTTTKRIATASNTPITTIATTTTVAKLATTKTTPVTTTTTTTAVDAESVGVAAAATAGSKTNTPEDPYVFTETVATTPPILFNAQKSRTRLNEAQLSRNCNSSGNNNRQLQQQQQQLQLQPQIAAGKKSSIVVGVGATSAAVGIAQLNGTATAVNVDPTRVVATTKAQASLGAAAAVATTTATTATTNFNNVTQSQRQPTAATQLQQLQQLQLQSSAQASPKRATNVCVVRPQQQQQQQQQQHQKQQPKLAKLTTKQHAVAQQQLQQQHQPPPPPLYTHTPSLWQTPLILDTTQKQQQQQQHYQQQQQQQSNAVVAATALVSPPISPASLSSPTAVNAPPTAAVTAMVSPIVLPPAASPVQAATPTPTAAAAATSPPNKGGSLPPSKFHHTTLAQHLQKVECLKKKKSLPLSCQNSNNVNNNNNNNNIVVGTLPKRQSFAAGFSLTQPPPLTAFHKGVAGAAGVATGAVSATETKKHSADAHVVVDGGNSDLNEIPVNVIFRKPPTLLTNPAMMTKLGTVAPLTPPTPTTPPSPLQGNVAPAAPLLIPQQTVAIPAPVATTIISSTPNEQMSSKVANTVVAAAKRRNQTAATSCRKGNKINNIKAEAPADEALPVAVAAPAAAAQQDVPAAVNVTALGNVRMPRRRKVAGGEGKRNSTELFGENEPLPLDDVPYCLQTRWLHCSYGKDPLMESPAQPGNRDREERIAVRKGLLRRQALQLLSTRPLQELPMRAARQRLQSVQNLLLKYQDHASQQQGIGVGNRCLVTGCKQPTLSMAAHCERHILNNGTQQLFQPCVAWRVNGSACQAPVFDMLHTQALCPAHSQLRQVLELQNKQKLPQQHHHHHQQQLQKEKIIPQLPRPMNTAASPVAAAVPVTGSALGAAGGKRKRKTNPNANPVGRPLKRTKKQQPDLTVTTAPASTKPVQCLSMSTLQRKSSTTSLESITSNSQSSAKSTHSALPPYIPMVVPPTLLPLSECHMQQQQLAKDEAADQQQQQPNHHQQQQPQMDGNLLANADEINQIVAQLAAAATNDMHSNNNNNNNNNSLLYNNNNSNNMSYCSNTNSNSGSSSGFPSFNAAFGNAMGGTGVGGGQSQGPIQDHPQAQYQQETDENMLLSTESLLSQHMFGICENSSAYASSEDTGLGGLSDSELVSGNNPGIIALNGAHLLEEHDLVNVFDTLQDDDAFNELFESVQQAECDAMDRALEIADKNLKCLQQTIGTTDTEFFNHFLDFGDDLLVDAVSSVMNSSPNTSGIDASTLFVDSSASGSGSINGSSSGLVQT